MSQVESPPIVNPHVARWSGLRSRLHSLVLHYHALPMLELIALGSTTTAALAFELGIHPTAAEHVAGVLRVQGLIETDDRISPGRPAHHITALGTSIIAGLADLRKGVA